MRLIKRGNARNFKESNMNSPRCALIMESLTARYHKKIHLNIVLARGE